MPTGANIVVNTIPATKSCVSQASSYFRKITKPGNHLSHPVSFGPLKLKLLTWLPSPRVGALLLESRRG
jgi:hypothetical protein